MVATEPNRPEWAWVANELLFQCAKQKPKVERHSVREWVCQSWQIKPARDYFHSH